MFMLGLVIGVTGGTCFGMFITCLLVAAKRTDASLVDMPQQDIKGIPDKQKQIRFCNGMGEELFCIPDGGWIQLTAPDGEGKVQDCHYVDEDHAEIDGRTWQMAEFARRMDLCGISFVPMDKGKEYERGRYDEEKSGTGDSDPCGSGRGHHLLGKGQEVTGGGRFAQANG